MDFERREIPAAEKRYPDMFALIDAAIDYMSEVIDDRGLPMPSSHLTLVRFAAATRAFNLLKSIRQLLATDHWENAAILMRSLFELVLNVEEIERDPGAAEMKAERFVRFETLQRARRLKAESDYEVQAKHKTEHDAKLTQLMDALPSFFGEWAVKRPDGTIKWKTSWCDRNVKELCQASGSTVRMGQYQVVYAYGSDMAHSSPLSVLSTFNRTDAPDLAALLAQTDVSERRETLSVLSLSVTFAFEVIGRAKFLDGAFDPSKMMEISRRFYGLHGVDAPPIAPEVAVAFQEAANRRNPSEARSFTEAAGGTVPRK